LIIKRDEDFEERMATHILRKMRGRRSGIHVTDLLYCLDKAYYRAVTPDEEIRPIEVQDALVLLMGAGHHGMIEGMEGFIDEHKATWAGITGSADMYSPTEGPVELKTTRAGSKKFDRDGLLKHAPHYVEQLKAYCLMRGVAKGRIVVFHLMGNYSYPSRPEMRAYSVEFTKTELAQLGRELRQRKNILEEAKQRGEPPMSGPRYGWECDRCEYRDRCKWRSENDKSVLCDD